MTKKKIFGLISFIYLLISLPLFLTDLGLNLIVVVLAYVFYLIGVLLALRYIYPKPTSFSRYHLLFIGFYFAAVFFLLYYFPNLGMAAKIFHIFAATIWTYLLLLAINIFIVSQKTETLIPLIQPAKVVVFISIIITVFFGSTQIYKLPVFENNSTFGLIARIFWFLIYYYFFTKSLNWVLSSYSIEKIGERVSNSIRKLETLIAVVLFEVSVILLFIPLESFARGIILSGVTYVLFTYATQVLGHKVKLSFYIESGLIILLTAIFATLV